MHPLLHALYGSGMAAAGLAASLTAVMAPRASGKVWRSLRARHGVHERWRAAATTQRDYAKPLVWLHAPSVGEGLQARPVAHALRAARPDVQQAYSFYSPSAERFAGSIGAELTDYLPFDTTAAADAMLDILRPNVLVFVKLDVWPVLVERAHARGVPVIMLSATLAAASGRRGWWSRALVHEAYAALTAVGAVDQANAERLTQLGVAAARVQVTGDTRFDQVWARAAACDRQAPLLRALASDRPTVVAGSTWPADEAVLLPAWDVVRRQVPNARLIIAPHEPTASHLEPIIAWATRQALRVASLTAVEHSANASIGPDNISAANADVIVVDRVGVLGDLYALASAAYVGGGFHRAGLHSAIEPAAFGAPVVFGPGYEMSREAALLLAADGAVSVSNADTMAAVLGGWLGDEPLRARVGLAARTVVEHELGATARSVQLVLEQLGSS